MKDIYRMFKVISIVIIAIVIASTPLKAQLVKQNLSYDQIYAEIKKLADINDKESNERLMIELKALADADNEEFNLLSAMFYNKLGDSKSAMQIRNEIVKKYPKGTTARDREKTKFINNEKISLDQKLNEYKSWLQKFPVASFPKKKLGSYVIAAIQLGQQFVKEGKIADAVKIVSANSEIAGTSLYLGIVHVITREMSNAGGYAEALPLLEETVKAIDWKEGDRVQGSILSIYLAALTHTGNIAKGADFIELLSRRAGEIVNTNEVLFLAKAYEEKGRALDAFQILENFLINTRIEKDVIAAIEPLYKKLNNGVGDYNEYSVRLNERILNALKVKYRSQMISSEAPDFTLINMQGEKVSLSDYRGKIVILDFWATWCGPCKMSFPGMQAAVDKYAGDSHIDFLFIDCFERSEDYKASVEKFIEGKNYSFHVLYDEMKDKDKAVTTHYGIRAIPTKIMVDPNGKIRFRFVGGTSNIDSIVADIDAMVELVKEGANNTE